MVLTNWKNSPKGKIRLTDIGTAKKYLNEKELKELNRIVTMYLDYAELQALNRKIMYMKDWIVKLDAFLEFNEQEILQNVGEVSHKVALSLAEKEFVKFDEKQNKKFKSDFDKEIKKLLKINK